MPAPVVPGIVVGMTTTLPAGPATRPSTSSGRRVRDPRTLRRGTAAAIMVLPATAIAVSRLVSPSFAADDTRQVLDLAAAQPGRMLAGVLLGSLAMLTLVPAFLAAARLARRRRPVLAMVAAGVNLLAYLGAGLAFGAIDALTLVASRLPADQRDSAAALIDAFAGSGLFGLSVGLFVIGHILGAVLMGLALRGTIPAYGWVAMAISQPLHFVCFVILQNVVLDAMAWGLTAFAFVVAAVVVLRTPDDDWDLPSQR